MRLKSLLLCHVVGVILAIVAPQSSAGPVGLVHITGEVGFSGTTGTGGFERCCEDDWNHVERGYFSLIYDPLVPDTHQDDNQGLFRGAIRSFEMSVSQVNRPDLAFSLFGRGDLKRSFLFSDGHGDWVTWEMTLEEKNGFIQPSTFSFNMYYHSVSPNPNEMPPIEFWYWVTGYVGGGAGVVETDWLNHPSIRVEIIPRPIPVPGTGWLLLIGTGMAFLQRARHKNAILPS